MKIICLLLTLAFSFAMQAQDPGAYRWKNRVILLFPGEALERQQALLEKHSADLLERDLLTLRIASADAALFKKYAVNPGTFTLILLGKDGGEKFRSSTVVDPAKLFALIDTMPMRQEEMKQPR